MALPNRTRLLVVFVLICITIGFGLITRSIQVDKARLHLEEEIAQFTREIALTLKSGKVNLLLNGRGPDFPQRARIHRQIEPLLEINTSLSGIMLAEIGPDLPSPRMVIEVTRGPDENLGNILDLPSIQQVINQRWAHSSTASVINLSWKKQNLLLTGFSLPGKQHTESKILIIVAADRDKLHTGALGQQHHVFVLSLVMALGIGGGFILRLLLYPKAIRSRYGMICFDVLWTFYLGACATLMVTDFLKTQYHEEKTHEFTSKARILERQVVESLTSLREFGTDTVASFFLNSDEVTANDFEGFTEHLLGMPGVAGWAWITPVDYEGKAALEESLRVRDGLEGFVIWEKDEKGQTIPVKERSRYYPITLASPEVLRSGLLAYDWHSDPLRGATLRAAIVERYPIATPPTPFYYADYQPHGFILAHPVFLSDGGNDDLKGFVLAGLTPESLIRELGRDYPEIDINLYFYNHDGYWQPLKGGNPRSSADLSETPLASLVPILIFGNTLLLETHPCPVAYKAMLLPPPAAMGLTLCLLLTTSAAWIVGMVSRQHSYLETMVTSRTEQLAQSERRYRLITENATDLIWVIDWDSQKMRFVSTSVKAMTGYEVEEVLQMGMLDLVLPEYREKIMNLFRKAVEDFLGGQNHGHTCTTRIRTRQGQIRWLEFSFRPSRNPDTHAIELSGSSRDITARKMQEEQVHLLANALDAAFNMVVIADRAGRIEWTNRAFTEVTGYTREEAQGMRPGDLLRSGIHDSSFYDSMWETISSGKVWHSEITNRKKDGTHYPEAMTITPIKDEDNRITHFIAIKRDLTEEKAREENHMRAQRLESIGFLAGGIAHDLNNALAPILMSVDLLRRDDLSTEDREEILESIQLSAKRGAAMVSQILDFARGVDGHKQVVSPRQIANDIENFIKNIIPKNIQFSVSVNTESASDVVWGDPTQLHQVLLNLCLNAIDAMPLGGSLSVSIDHVDAVNVPAGPLHANSNGDYLCITVEDSGTGIPADLIDKVFDPFFTTKEVGKGTGLGLPTSHAIIQSHGGFINVSSVPNRGSRFTVFIPCHHDGKPVTAHVSAGSRQPFGHGETILLVDDEPLVRSSLKMVLEDAGYHVVVAENGMDAVAQVKELTDQLALVLTDLSMPIMDGYATARLIHQINPDLPIIATSGQPMQEETCPSIKCFLLKPYSPSDILKAIHHLLGSGKHGAKPAKPPQPRRC